MTTKFKDIFAGDLLKADAGFDCLEVGQTCVVFADDGLQKGLHVTCSQGKHYLDGCFDDNENLVGFEKV
jgi:hypothetical protein